jgi:hypothetical protein
MVNVVYHLVGVGAATSIGTTTMQTQGNRVFILAGVSQYVLPPGVVIYPTSDTIAVGTTAYIVGSSQFYTIGQVAWNNTVQVQGVDWQFVAPFTHIIELLVSPSSVHTPVQLTYDRWNIGVSTGFEITDSPVSFTVSNTTIVAEELPQPDDSITVFFTANRAMPNPQSLMAIYPLIVDDMLSIYNLYDAPNGFQTYRPIGYQVLDMSLLAVFTWDGTAWGSAVSLANGSQFYVKRLRTIYQIDGLNVVAQYVVGSGLDAAFPQVIAYPRFGEGIGKNLINDGVAGNAQIAYPAAYEVAISPGDYDSWVHP